MLAREVYADGIAVAYHQIRAVPQARNEGETCRIDFRKPFWRWRDEVDSGIINVQLFKHVQNLCRVETFIQYYTIASGAFDLSPTFCTRTVGRP